MSLPDCRDVCDIVLQRLAEIGFDTCDDEDHTPVIEALDRIRFVRTEEKEPQVVESPELRDAKIIAEEILRIVATDKGHPGESIREHIGEQIDLSDEAMSDAWETIKKNRIQKGEIESLLADHSILPGDVGIHDKQYSEEA